MISGRITGKVTLNGDIMSFYLLWRAVSNIAGNYSDVTVETYWETTNTNWGFDTTGSRKASITINGVKSSINKVFDTTEGTGSGWKVDNPWLIQSATQRVYHNNDGSKSIAVSARANGTAGIYGPSAGTSESYDCTVSGTIVLEDIPRASSISASTAVVGASSVITIGRAVDTFTHTITYEFAGNNRTLTGTIVSESFDTTIPWTLPTALYQLMPNSPSIEGTLKCVTYNGDTVVGETSCTILATTSRETCAPTLAPTAVDSNSATVALTGDSNVVVKYRSNVVCTFNAAARNYATIVSKSVVCGSSSLQEDGTFNGATSGTFVFSVTDSRGYTTSVTLNKTLVNYIPLSCTVTNEVFNGEGEIAFSVNGNCFTGSFGAQSNQIVVQYRYRAAGGAFSEWQTAPVTVEADKYSASVLVTGADYTKVYSVQARVVDSLGSAESNVINVSAFPVFDWSREDFNFNVPVNCGAGLLYLGKHILDVVYPVGSIYLAYNHTNPASLFGGTWVRIENAFLWAVDAEGLIGQTGGAKEHILTVDELPSHRHMMNGIEVSRNEGGYVAARSATFSQQTDDGTTYTDYEGEGVAHNNMPPYIQVSAWRRTA